MNVQSEQKALEFLRHYWGELWPRDRARILATNPKTFWLFGAGASYHYNLNSAGVSVPLANGFFSAFNRLPTSRGFSAHVGPLISYLGEYRGVPPDRVSDWTENIETFMTSLEKGIEVIKRHKKPSAKQRYKGMSLATAFNNMTFILGNVINEAQNGPTESLYSYLLDFCGPNDVFVTFNWDTLIDRALAATGGWSPNNGYGLRFSSALDGTWKSRVSGSTHYHTNWRLLKLHGSTNWLVPYSGYQPITLDFRHTVPKSDRIFLYWQSTLNFATHQGRWKGGYAPTCYGYYPPHIPGRLFPPEHLSAGPGRTFVKVTQTGVVSPFSERNMSGAPSSPLLITPVRQKRYTDYQSSIQDLWTQAEQRLSEAERIVIVGYSFPKTDVRAKALLARALEARKGQVDLEIIAPDAKNIAARIGSQILRRAKSVNLFSEGFEDYVARLMRERAPILMAKAAHEHKDIQDWLTRLLQLTQIPHDYFRKKAESALAEKA